MTPFFSIDTLNDLQIRDEEIACNAKPVIPCSKKIMDCNIVGNSSLDL